MFSSEGDAIDFMKLLAKDLETGSAEKGDVYKHRDAALQKHLYKRPAAADASAVDGDGRSGAVTGARKRAHVQRADGNDRDRKRSASSRDANVASPSAARNGAAVGGECAPHGDDIVCGEASDPSDANSFDDEPEDFAGPELGMWEQFELMAGPGPTK